MNLCSPDCLVCKWNLHFSAPPDKRMVVLHEDLGNMVGIGRITEGDDEEDYG